MQTTCSKCSKPIEKDRLEKGTILCLSCETDWWHHALEILGPMLEAWLKK